MKKIFPKLKKLFFFETNSKYFIYNIKYELANIKIISPYSIKKRLLMN